MNIGFIYKYKINNIIRINHFAFLFSMFILNMKIKHLTNV